MSVIDRLQNVFNQLNANNLHLLKEIYADNASFEDPAHRIYGINNLTNYFSNLYSNIGSCKFIFNSTTVADKTAFLEWNMHLTHPKLNKGKVVIVSGISKIIFDEKIVYHRDYFDLGEMLYEQLPYLGAIIKQIKKRLGQ